MTMAERARVLVIDDDSAVVELLVEELGAHHDVAGETSPRAGLERAIAEDFDIVITDVEMPELRGPALLAELLERKPGQLVLLITAFGSIELAVQAVRAGACDFVTKPFQIPALLLAVERALRERTMRREIVRLRRELDDDHGNLIAASPAMTRVLDVARRAARSTVSVLITGESGSGKGALARWIHERSPRSTGPFVHVNCAALPSGLVEAELFGVRRGAFTDARESRDGLFAEASGGTIFLDEIAEMPLDVQSKLLQVLESSRVRPVGGGEVAIDVRVIAATNRAIDGAVHAGQFRVDLFFRLNVIRIEVPPLRDRPGDIPELVHALLARASRGGTGPIGITDDAMRWLVRHDWPGNVRELANVVERAVALTDHDTIVLEDVRDLPPRAPVDPTSDLLTGAAERHLPLAEVERGYIRRVLDAEGGNVSRAARILGIDRRTLYRKLG
ncbi:MAG TPA: sigma-54 dependent transcriptional regulator [Kofleriaceae bacterium]